MSGTYLFPSDKNEMYKTLHLYCKGLISDNESLVSKLSNLSAIINLALENINWVGFYLLDGEDLVLGPFQGKPACVRLQKGKGVCQKAVESKATILVDDVHAFSGHIACDSESNSEIVIPLKNKCGEVVAVLDIDSPIKSRFDESDKQGLEAVCMEIDKYCF